MKSIRILGIVAILFLLAACNSEQDVPLAAEQAMVEELLAPADPDKQLSDKVNRALGLDTGAVPYGVDVTVSDGRVILWGTVDSTAARKRFEITAAGVVGVKAIENHLQVDPGA